MDSHFRRLSAFFVVTLTTWHAATAVAAEAPDWDEVHRVVENVNAQMESHWKADKVQPAP